MVTLAFHRTEQMAFGDGRATFKALLSSSILLASFISLVGCAGVTTRSSNSTSGSVALNGTTKSGASNKSKDSFGSKSSDSAEADLSDTGSDLDALPLEVNKSVLKWIDYFQGVGRPHMERYLSRSTRYMPIMKKILKEQGLPEDLIYIALIESGFSSSAKSSAKAVGYWQFIRPTGRRYGLRVDNYVDERRDFEKSTLAAADYFKGLYNLFGAWYLAIASYNVGENRVKNLVMKYHTRDFWKLARENKLPYETQDYVPKFLAARLIAKEPEKYGFGDVEFMPPLEYSEATFTNSIDLHKLASAMNLEYDDLHDLNPSYKKGVAFAQGGKLKLRVPKGTELQAIAAAPQATAEDRHVYVADDDFSYYRVRRGDTIATIAKKFATTQREILSLNHLHRGARLSAGRRIRVPAENVALAPKAAAYENLASKKKTTQPMGRSRTYKVAKVAKADKLASSNKVTTRTHIHIFRRGETLAAIAKKYRVSVRQIMDHNQLNHRAQIPVGARIEIP